MVSMTPFRKSVIKAAIILVLAFAAIFVPEYNEFSDGLRDPNSPRRMSINLGGGQCLWTPPIYDVPDQKFAKTLIVGYPSGDKRLTYVQMEALTGLSARDEWDFKVRVGESARPDKTSAEQLVLLKI